MNEWGPVEKMSPGKRWDCWKGHEDHPKDVGFYFECWKANRGICAGEQRDQVYILEESLWWLSEVRLYRTSFIQQSARYHDRVHGNTKNKNAAQTESTYL